MAWIKSSQELGRHPKTKRLSKKLGVSLVTTVGHLQFFWWWVADFARDGDLSGYDAAEIADASLWEGDADVFLDALLTVGYIDSDTMRVHDWMEHTGNELARLNRKAKYYADLKEEGWFEVRQIVLERDKSTCAYCGAEANAVDHIIPRIQQGESTFDNLVAACKSCNSRKGGRTPEQAGMTIGGWRHEQTQIHKH